MNSRNILLFRYLFIGCALFMPAVLLAQQVVPQTSTSEYYREKYFVLKHDRTVKHGEFMKFENDLLDRPVISEIGNFAHGDRDGNWYFFYPRGSALRMEGHYSMGKKTGEWKEYYSTTPPNEEGNLTLENTLAVNEAIRTNDQGNTYIRKDNITYAALGDYKQGQKVGIWQYYDYDGNVTHRYDHSTGRLVYSSGNTSDKFTVPYLGSTDRFINQLYFLDNNIKSIALVKQNTFVLFHCFLNNGEVIFEEMKNEGDLRVIKEIRDQLKNIDRDNWILDDFDQEGFYVGFRYTNDVDSHTDDMYFSIAVRKKDFHFIKYMEWSSM